MPHNVTEEPEGERHDARQVTDDFNDQNQRAHPPDRTQKMFDIFGAVVLDTEARLLYSNRMVGAMCTRTVFTPGCSLAVQVISSTICCSRVLAALMCTSTAPPSALTVQLG